jgi:hypothetical protein
MDDLGINDDRIKIKLGNQEYPIDFTMASIYYLADKYGDVAALFSGLKNGVDTKSLDVICDLIYAGIGTYDDDDNFNAPLSVKKIMARIHFKDIESITGAVTKAFAGAFPDAKKNPTKGAKSPAKIKDGTGDTSTPSESSSLD